MTNLRLSTIQEVRCSTVIRAHLVYIDKLCCYDKTQSKRSFLNICKTFFRYLFCMNNPKYIHHSFKKEFVMTTKIFYFLIILADYIL